MDYEKIDKDYREQSIGDINFKKGDKVYHKWFGTGIFEGNLTIMKAFVIFVEGGLQRVQKRTLALYNEETHNKPKEVKTRIKELSEYKKRLLERNNKIKNY